MGRRGLAVAAAEQEGEPLQVLAQLVDVIGGMAGELA
jgi:crotonobetainyl-CoA:carnitine CoA-transferase CaiB-like acyl-CoA transferase